MWRRFLTGFVVTVVLVGGTVYGFILLVDPYRNVPFSPALPRVPIDLNQRFSYPPIARDSQFDSVVVGTSTARLLDPRHLDTLFHARFANLAMNSATAWEQTQMSKLFLRHHPQARNLIIGVDRVWCDVGDHYERTTFRLFPDWMYDENRWNDLLYLFNDKALEQAVRELQYLRGKRPAKYRPDGYGYFLPADSVYNLAKARASIYGRANVELASLPPPPLALPTETHPEIHFPAHALLPELLAAASPATVKVIFFVPYHENMRRNRGQQLGECKGRIVDIAAHFANTHVLDYMIDSSITRNDENYWDVMHYTRAVSRIIEHSLASAVAERADVPEVLAYLTPVRVTRAPSAH